MKEAMNLSIYLTKEQQDLLRDILINDTNFTEQDEDFISGKKEELISKISGKIIRHQANFTLYRNTVAKRKRRKE